MLKKQQHALSKHSDTITKKLLSSFNLKKKRKTILFAKKEGIIMARTGNDSGRYILQTFNL